MNNKKAFFKKIQHEISEVPSYLQKLWTKNAHDNFVSLSMLDDSDIKEMEQLCVSSVTDMEMEMTDFGTYYARPSITKFNIKNSHKKLLFGIRGTILNKGVQHYFNHLALTSPTKQILEVSNIQSNHLLTTHETSKEEGQIKIEEKKIRIHVTNLLNERYGLNHAIDKNVSLDFEMHVIPDYQKYIEKVSCPFVTF
jgi:hypothetical protein